MGRRRSRIAQVGAGSERVKKKALNNAKQIPLEGEDVSREALTGGRGQDQKLFYPPETDSDDLSGEMFQFAGWDLAIRYHELKARPSMKALVPRLRRLSADSIIERARNVLGSVVLPVDQRSCSLSELPPSAEQPDLDVEETLENSPLVSCRNESPLPQDIWMSYRAHRKQPIILSLDTSLSMTGEKLALTAVALAVVLLQFPDDSIGIIAFENEAKVIKHPEERVSVLELIERFLDIPAQGYTHLEDGMAAALKLLKETRISGQTRPASTVLLTDGKYTAGRDPAYLAPRFPHLIVLKMGQERASLELCRELARKGNGLLREVGELEALPVVMYGVVKDLLRGRSLG